MQIARTDPEKTTILEVGHYKDLFPNVSFTSSGPSDQFLSDNNCLWVKLSDTFNRATHKMIPADPYIEGNFVKLYQIVEMTQEEKDAYQRSLIPSSVSQRQARLALLQAGVLTQVDAALDSIVDDTQRMAAKIEWQYSQTIERDSPLIDSLAPLLGLTESEVDNLFTLAATL